MVILALSGSEGLWIDPRVEDHPFNGWAAHFPLVDPRVEDRPFNERATYFPMWVWV